MWYPVVRIDEFHSLNYHALKSQAQFMFSEKATKIWSNMKLLYTQGRCDIHCSATRQPMTVVCHHTPQRTRFMSIAGPPESIGTWGSEPHQFWADKWELLYLGGQNIPTNFFHILMALMSIGGQGTLLHHNSYSPA